MGEYRDYLAGLGADEYRAESRKRELEYFHETHRYCGKCGAPMRPGLLSACDSEEVEGAALSMVCPACGAEVFPRLNPAIVVLVTRGEQNEEALLVHSASFRGDMHALVAGFVEAGENIEQCVAREIREETDLEVSDIRYIGSQSWPFPSQLMIGFTARYRSGTLRFADGELTSGGWFRRDGLPLLPTPPSLSRAIIDKWIRGEI